MKQVQVGLKRDSIFTSTLANPLSQNKNHSNSTEAFILPAKKTRMYVSYRFRAKLSAETLAIQPLQISVMKGTI
jgi:hypothetical protein